MKKEGRGERGEGRGRGGERGRERGEWRISREGGQDRE